MSTQLIQLPIIMLSLYLYGRFVLQICDLRYCGAADIMCRCELAVRKTFNASAYPGLLLSKINSCYLQRFKEMLRIPSAWPCKILSIYHEDLEDLRSSKYVGSKESFLLGNSMHVLMRTKNHCCLLWWITQTWYENTFPLLPFFLADRGYNKESKLSWHKDSTSSDRPLPCGGKGLLDIVWL